MSKSLFLVALATCVVCACSQPNPPQSQATGGPTPAPATRAEAQPPQPTGATTAAADATSGQGAKETPAQQAPPPQAAAAPSTPAAAAQSPAESAATRSGQSAAESSARSTAPPKVSDPPAPKFREVTIPAGTSLSVTLLSTLASNTSKVEDPVKGSLAKPIVVSGTTVLPAGATISGTVTDVKESGRVKGRASIAFRFHSLVARGETYQIQTARVTREAAANRGSDVKKGGVGAGLGAVVGAVAGGGKGAAIGAVAGGTGAVLATKGDEVQVAPGTVVTVLLQEPILVLVPINN